MNYSEQEYRLAREVLHLHSLWHQGPPSSNPSFSSRHTPCHGPTLYLRSSFSNPNRYFHPNPNPSLYYTNHQSSRRTHERCSKRQKKDSSPENEWPCDPASVTGQSPPHTWPPFEQAVQNPTLSPNSAGRDALISTQLSAIQSCKNFFSQDSDSESESECELGSDYDVDQFFMGLFENDVGLRGCYEKDRDNGEFYCLVCEARRDGNKGKRKMYRGCAALAQHASAIRKISRRAAHRALARSICWVLGWDLQRLPSIVLLPGSVVKANHSEDKKETVAIQITNSISDSPEIWKGDTNDGPPGFTIEREPANIPGTSACSLPEVVPESGDSGSEKISKGKDLDP